MKKITQQKQSEIFEKIVSQHGRLFRVRFVVLERGGKLRGKVISCEAIFALGRVEDSGLGIKNLQYCLPCGNNTAVKLQTCHYSKEIRSPYFDKSELLTPIKIRAPSR